jgi:hypothetical protein
MNNPSTSRHSTDGGQPPTIDYWHVWTDSEGISHQSRCQLQNFVRKSISPPADPQWLNELQEGSATVVFTVMPVGWVGSWHENPKPQWIIPLSGCWFVETMDGQRVEMGVGDLSFGEDQNTKANADGNKGHLSGTVGNVPAVLMMVQLQEDPTVGQACRFQ